MFTPYSNLSWLARKLLIYSLQMLIRYDPILKKQTVSLVAYIGKSF